MPGLRPIALVGLAILGFAGCSPAPISTPAKNPSNKSPGPKTAEAVPEPGIRLQSEPFGDTHEGVPITQYHLSNDQGMTVSIIEYGATVTSILVPDRNGKAANVVLGFSTLDGYLGKQPYFGCIVGRYANRIAKGKFKLNGKEYTLAVNDGPNHLHGGLKSFSQAVWHAHPSAGSADGKSKGLELMYESPDGEEGYPGKVKVTVVYTLTDANELRLDYRAVSDKPTIINLSNHCYWNLAGAGKSDIFPQRLTLDADKFLAVDDGLIPTGKMTLVKGTPMDFLSPTPFGAHINEIDGGGGYKGYDHCYVLNPRTDALKQAAARVEDPESGRVLEIFTTEPGIQLYTGNQLTGKPEDGGFKKFSAFCLECQHFPDSPNHPEFPTTVLEPDKPYTQTTIHRFSIK